MAKNRMTFEKHQLDAQKKRKAEEAARLAIEKRKAEEKVKRLVAEKKRKAEEAERLAEKKRKAGEETIRLAEEEKRKAEEAKRIAVASPVLAVSSLEFEVTWTLLSDPEGSAGRGSGTLPLKDGKFNGRLISYHRKINYKLNSLDTKK